ncbi:zinc-binding dehydrogenase [Lysinibacillus sp. SGAir0095]|uniref:zinc-dependent alcohol dehydrogenase n=1 Tax=Lysinibacillus sp. SGAir0095 TaxID=2070463 RepID=UPI0010CCEFBC|nr:alcohol dehydrogenase catalytic domain-containing protein [Lysinibacillus sp. SGAir0095]QCR33512.1 dehydrogenase [Lysinibacillus sp. SGAir0095]
MKAIFYTAPNRVECREASIPSVPKGYVLLKNAYAGICGTDLNIFAGTHPRAQAPLILGHEFSATIESEHPKYPIGTKVTVNPLISCGSCIPCSSGQSHVCEDLKLVGIDVDGGMAEYVVVEADKVIPLPEGVSLELGALSEPIAVAVHAVRTARFLVGDRAVVYGAGTIGLCVALTLRAYGASEVIVIEANELRLQKAKELGFKTLNSLKDDVVNELAALTGNAGMDYVFDCAGHPAVLRQVTEIVKVQGTIVIVAAYKKPTEMNLIQGMFKELSMQFVRVYTKRDIELALDLLTKVPEFSEIITHVLSPEQAAEGFELLTTPTNAIKVLYAF